MNRGNYTRLKVSTALQQRVNKMILLLLRSCCCMSTKWSFKVLRHEWFFYALVKYENHDMFYCDSAQITIPQDGISVIIIIWFTPANFRGSADDFTSSFRPILRVALVVELELLPSTTAGTSQDPNVFPNQVIVIVENDCIGWEPYSDIYMKCFGLCAHNSYCDCLSTMSVCL